jgi:hypothetical protein
LPGVTLDVTQRLVREAHGRICPYANALCDDVLMELTRKYAGNSQKERRKTMDPPHVNVCEVLVRPTTQQF